MMPITCAHFWKHAARWRVIPNKINRVNRYPFDDDKYKSRNVIERTIGRMKDFRAIATRYDKTARNFLAGVCLVAAIIWWLN